MFFTDGVYIHDCYVTLGKASSAANGWAAGDQVDLEMVIHDVSGVSQAPLSTQKFTIENDTDTCAAADNCMDATGEEGVWNVRGFSAVDHGVAVVMIDDSSVDAAADADLHVNILCPKVQTPL